MAVRTGNYAERRKQKSTTSTNKGKKTGNSLTNAINKSNLSNQNKKTQRLNDIKENKRLNNLIDRGILDPNKVELSGGLTDGFGMLNSMKVQSSLDDFKRDTAPVRKGLSMLPTPLNLGRRILSGIANNNTVKNLGTDYNNTKDALGNFANSNNISTGLQSLYNSFKNFGEEEEEAYNGLLPLTKPAQYQDSVSSFKSDATLGDLKDPYSIYGGDFNALNFEPDVGESSTTPEINVTPSFRPDVLTYGGGLPVTYGTSDDDIMQGGYVGYSGTGPYSVDFNTMGQPFDRQNRNRRVGYNEGGMTEQEYMEAEARRQSEETFNQEFEAFQRRMESPSIEDKVLMSMENGPFGINGTFSDEFSDINYQRQLDPNLSISASASRSGEDEIQKRINATLQEEMLKDLLLSINLSKGESQDLQSNINLDYNPTDNINLNANYSPEQDQAFLNATYNFNQGGAVNRAALPPDRGPMFNGIGNLFKTK